MGLILKHVGRTKAGIWQYRRRVPDEVSAIITKREFKRKLGDSEREALAAYLKYHTEVENEIAEAKLGRVRSETASSAKATEREAYAEALRRRADLVAAGASDRDLALTADSIAEAYPQGYDYEPQGVPPVERHAINLLRLGPERYKAPVPTLGDARKVYIKEHLRGDDPTTDSRIVGFANRVVDAAIAVIGRDPELTAITREDARNIRDEMLDRVKITGRGIGEKVSASTVGRELTILSAVVSYGIRELGLPDTTANPFHGLPVARVAKGRGQKPGEKRDPLPPEVLKAARQRILSSCSPALQLIWRILEGTGCRLAEVTGLTVDDVDVSGPFPHIRVAWNENRRLKTETSQRSVPLVGDALDAAKEALKLAVGYTMLFPDYGRVRGSDTASAALMKQLRKVTSDPKHVVHSLRHNMKDRLMVAEVSSLDQNLILGHALGGVGDRVYGGDVAKLRVTTRAMMRAFGIAETTGN
ncbi:tyrosine-type recombinase/integrase [Pseudotabrizicola alkalilacus]|uniref:Tyr recombinase domain-containing protein n=1 Tax=Pseudotabrizicola alkalilacus TaxID=2305252 RepID=A0A411Z3S9_9RHOB|nr:tyrosine-type recombinase/integrase [Pseudotabrizicola alkalilacus]RGP37728.1 hypothetical protein D1012_07385 [Pseudotabrizicola alkalilacus]